MTFDELCALEPRLKSLQALALAVHPEHPHTCGDRLLSGGATSQQARDLLATVPESQQHADALLLLAPGETLVWGGFRGAVRQLVGALPLYERKATALDVATRAIIEALPDCPECDESPAGADSLYA